MEIITDIINHQLTLYIPVVLVIVIAILVFTFGFKAAEQPSFDKLIADERRQSAKKKKIKEKKSTVNGYVATGDLKSEKSPVKEPKRSPTKEADAQRPNKERKIDNKQAEKNKKNEAIRNKNISEEMTKSKKKKVLTEKPVDFDEGDWETVLSKADKKKKPEQQQQSPIKKEKKSKKVIENNEVENEKLAKEVVNKELKNKKKKNETKEEKPIESNSKEEEEEVVVIEEKKEKKVKKEIEQVGEKEAVIAVANNKLSSKTTPAAATLTKLAKALEVVDQKDESSKTVSKEGIVAFDELGDVWTEAKVAKKSKKKPRRDN